MWHKEIIKLYTLYLALLTMRLPSRSHLTEGLGLPKAVQVKVMLPPSLASTYWGGVSVNVGGAEESRDRKFGEKNKWGHVKNISKGPRTGSLYVSSRGTDMTAVTITESDVTNRKCGYILTGQLYLVTKLFSYQWANVSNCASVLIIQSSNFQTVVVLSCTLLFIK